MNKMRLDTFISDYGDGIHGTPTYSDNGEYCFINGIMAPMSRPVTKI
jgi:hypothetical protein